MSNPMASVLVVDDEWTIRQQLTRALTSVGLQCDCATDGDEALDRFIVHQYDLVVTDLRMPERNGHSLAVTLLNQPIPPIIVALTGVTEPRLANDLLARGVANVVYKPTDYFELADYLKGLINSSSSRLMNGKGITESCEPPADLNQSAGDPERPLWARQQVEQRLATPQAAHAWLAFFFKWIDWDRIPELPSEVHSVIRQLLNHPSHVLTDRRSEGRIILSEKAVALCLSDDQQPMGDPFKVFIRDLSENGIGIVNTRPIETGQLAISWRDTQMNRIVAIARVLRCGKVGEFYDVGAMFVRN